MNTPLYVVGIGASAGGLDPLEKLFSSMPKDTGCAFVVVQHLSPDFKSLMDDLLGRKTDIPIVKAEDGQVVNPNTIYLPPPGTQVSFKEGKLSLSSASKEPRGSTRIDQFFESLGKEFGSNSVAIVLSGSGSDGTHGATKLHAEGGFVIAQDPETAQFDSMPRSVIQAECVDIVLPPEKIAEVVRLHVTDPNAKYEGVQFQDDDGKEIDPIKLLFRALRDHLGINFSEYKKSTIERRILRRVALTGKSNIGEYIKDVVQDKNEIDKLYHDFLIGVTEFFRDPDAFSALKKPLLERMKDKDHSQDFRVWSAGCASGQEAYSLAILLDELANECDYRGKIIIYATDAHRGSIAKASEALFEESSLLKMSTDRLARCFSQTNTGLYRINEHYRKMVIFAPHNLVSDPPFTRMDLVSCRNLLIYLDSEAQSKVLKNLNFSLSHLGIMFLGHSEGLSDLVDHFEPINAKAKIFRKVRQVVELPISSNLSSLYQGNELTSYRSAKPQTVRIEKELLNAYDVILARHIPAGIIMTVQGEVLHYFGNCEKFFETTTGRPSENIFNRISGELKMAITTLVQRIEAGESRVQYQSVRYGKSSQDFINVVADSIPSTHSRPLYLHLSFQAVDPNLAEQTSPESAPQFDPESEAARQIHSLEIQLASTRENLQASIEELQTTNEELQTTNEEMLASNEELQSTNEELHSVNEELYTVNAEYSSKNQQLMTLNAEHTALLESIDIGTLFVDRDLVIRKFNHAVESVVKLLPQDVGRPLEHLATSLTEPEQLLSDAKKVLQTASTIEREICTRNGTWYNSRIFPFIYPNGSIEGVVLTFSDLTQIREMQAQVRANEERLALAIENTRQGLWEINPVNGHAYFNDSWYRLFEYTKESVDSTLLAWEKLIHEDDRDIWRDAFYSSLNNDQVFSCEFRVTTRSGSWRWVLCRGRVCARDAVRHAIRVLGLVTDITHMKEMEFAFRSAERSLELSLQAAKQVWWEWNIPSGKLVTHGIDHCILGYSCFDLDKHEDFWWNLIPDEERAAMKHSLNLHFEQKTPIWESEHRYKSKDGKYRWVIEYGRVVEWDSRGKPLRMIGITQLNDDRKKSEIELEQTKQLYESIVEDQEDLVFRFTPDFVVSYANQSFAKHLGKPIQEIIGTGLQTLISAEDFESMKIRLARLKPAQPSSSHAQSCARNYGETDWIEWCERAFYDPKQNVLGYQTVGHDITAIKQKETELTELLEESKRARALAEQANQAKSEFLAVMNHELRTPLNPIIAGSELLRENETNPDNVEIAGMIHTAGKHLLGLINSVLDLSKLEANQFNPEYRAFYPQELLLEVFSLYESAAMRKEITYTQDIAENIPQPLLSDETMLKQVVGNLLSNAIKFTRNGSVTLKASFECADPKCQQVNLIIQVKDTGIGIPAHLTEKIFDIFSQADSGVTRNFGGTGIGLSISQKICKLLNGSITVESVEGKGSTFTCVIPMIKDDEAIESPPISEVEIDSSIFKDLEILVVDDDAMNRKVIHTLLRDQVESIDDAVDGIEALNRVRNKQYDVIIMDIHMPHMNGFETVEVIYKENKWKTSPKIIFVTADTRETIHTEPAMRLASGFITKPVTRNIMLATIQQALT